MERIHGRNVGEKMDEEGRETNINKNTRTGGKKKFTITSPSFLPQTGM